MITTKTFLQQHFQLAYYESNYIALSEHESILAETYSLIHDIELYHSVLTQLIKDKKFTYIKRLANWLVYFNEKQFHNSMIYNGIISAVLNASIKNELIIKQTQFEFETSISFFDIFYSLQLNCSLKFLKPASMFLNMAIIFGCYPGMQVGSLKKAFQLLEGEIDQSQLKKCFQTIFVKYETPNVLVNDLDKIVDKKTIELLLELLRGKNLKNLNYTDLKLTKRECHLFVNYEGESLNFESDILKCYFVYFKLLGIDEGETNTVHLFLNCSKLFQLKLFKFIDHIDFWQQAFRIYVAFTREQKQVLNVREYVDYIEFKKFDENANYTLTGRTFDSIKNAIETWHRRGYYEKHKEMLNFNWEPLNLPEIEIEFKNDTYVFQELTSGALLSEESDKMNHCVFSYTISCAKGIYRIFSVKKKVNNRFIHWLTIQLSKNEIVQSVGVNNRKLSKIEIGMLEYWAKENELKVAI